MSFRKIEIPRLSYLEAVNTAEYDLPCNLITSERACLHSGRLVPGSAIAHGKCERSSSFRSLSNPAMSDGEFTPPTRAKSRRSIDLTAGSVVALRAHRKRQLGEMMRKAGLWQDHGLVFPSSVGTPLSHRNVVRSCKAVLRRAELPSSVRLYDLRHTCATLLLSRNVHPKYVQELLGHASIAQTLDTYSHVLPGMGGRITSAMEDALG